MNAGSTVRRVARWLARGAELASTRFPVPALCIVAFAILANAEVAKIGWLASESLGLWMAALYAAAAAGVVGKLSMEAHGAKPVIAQVVSLVAALLIGLITRYSAPLGVFAPALVAAVSLVVPLAPYVRRPDDRRFWTFTLWTGVGIVLAFLSVLLFVLGVSAILEMVRFLFDVGLAPDAYWHMYTTALTLVGPLIALGRIPADFDDGAISTGEDRMAGGVRLLFDWVAAPLALTTAVVLHLYAAKILVLGDLPRNEVGWIVTSFALLVLSLRIGAEPFLATGRRFARLFARAWAFMLVVPLGLLVIAIGQRVGPEGWTPERYYLALGALAAVMILVAQTVPKWRGGIRLIAAVPLTLLALSSFGPQGVGDTVGRSQAARLAALMVDRDGRGVIETGRSDQARSRIAVLAEVGELARVLPIVPESDRHSVATEIAKDASERGGSGFSMRSQDVVARSLGATIEPAIASARIRSFYAPLQSPFLVTGYDLVVPGRTMLPGSMESTVVNDFGATLEGTDLVLRVGAIEDRFPLRVALEAVPREAFDDETAANMPVDVELSSSSGRKIRMILQSLSLDGEDRPTALSGTILLRRGDWPAAALFRGGPEAGVAEPGGAVGESPR